MSPNTSKINSASSLLHCQGILHDLMTWKFYSDYLNPPPGVRRDPPILLRLNSYWPSTLLWCLYCHVSHDSWSCLWISDLSRSYQKVFPRSRVLSEIKCSWSSECPLRAEPQIHIGGENFHAKFVIYWARTFNTQASRLSQQNVTQVYLSDWQRSCPSKVIKR